MFGFIRRNLHHRNEMMAWQQKYNANAPKAGDEAPDFTLNDSSGHLEVTLSQFRDKRPVALVFGSFT
jgi:peroxiredoxin